jgi:hypothetical protein
MEQRDSMIFYRSFYESICGLSIEQQGLMYSAIFNYGLNFNEPKFDGILLSIWTLIKPQLDANIKRFSNGKKAKHKQTTSKKEADNKQGESETEANNNVNVNDINNNIPTYHEFLTYAKTLPIYKPSFDYSITAKYNQWVADGWKDGHKTKITNWKTKLQNAFPYFKEVNTQTKNTPPKGFV